MEGQVKEMNPSIPETPGLSLDQVMIHYNNYTITITIQATWLLMHLFTAVHFQFLRHNPVLVFSPPKLHLLLY